MKRSNKKNLMLIGVAAGACSLLVGANLITNPAANAENTDAYTLYVDGEGKLYNEAAEGRNVVDLELTMGYGASIRLVAGEGNGIRFLTNLNKSAYDALSVAVEKGNVSLGTLIAPTYLVGETLDFDDNAKNYADIKQTEAGWHSTQDAYCYTAALYNIPAEAVNMNYTGQGYAKFTLADGSEKIVYAKTAAAGDGEQATNVRSVKYVADKAIADTSEKAPDEEQKKTLSEISSMKEDGVSYNALLSGATTIDADANGVYGSAYTIEFGGENALRFEGNTYSAIEMAVKFNEAVSYNELVSDGIVEMFSNGAHVYEAPADEWVMLVVSGGSTLSVNKTVSATVYKAKNYNAEWSAENRKDLFCSAIASDIEVRTADGGYYGGPSASKTAGYQNVTLGGVTKRASAVYEGIKTTSSGYDSIANVWVNGSISKETLQTMKECGYAWMSLSVAYEWKEELQKGDSYFKTIADWSKDNNWALGEKQSYSNGTWITISYSLEELIANYNKMFGAKNVNDSVAWVRVGISNNSSELGTEFAKVYVTDFTFGKEIAEPEVTVNGEKITDGVQKWISANAGFTATVNDAYALKLNGESVKEGTMWKTGVNVLTASSPYSASSITATYIVEGADGVLTGLGNISDALVASSNGGWCACTLPNNKGLDSSYTDTVMLGDKVARHWNLGQHSAGGTYSWKQIYITNYYAKDAGRSGYSEALTLKMLQDLAGHGYTTLSFSIALASDTVDGAATDKKAAWYTLDFDKIAGNWETAKAALNVPDKGSNLSDYVTNRSSAENEWVNVSFKIQDIIENYDYLDIVPLVIIGHDNSFCTGDLYMTDFTFSK